MSQQHEEVEAANHLFSREGLFSKHRKSHKVIDLVLVLDIPLRINRSQMFFKIDILRNFTISHENTCVGLSF